MCIRETVLPLVRRYNIRKRFARNNAGNVGQIARDIVTPHCTHWKLAHIVQKAFPVCAAFLCCYLVPMRPRIITRVRVTAVTIQRAFWWTRGTFGRCNGNRTRFWIA